MTTIKTRFTALLAAGALALGMAGPAAAASDGQKALNTVLGLLALGAVINQLDKHSEPDRRAVTVTPRYDPRRGDHDWGDRDRRWDGHRDGHRDGRREDRREGRPQIRVPAVCVQSFHGRSGRSEAVSQDCLIRNRVEGRLPQACAFSIRDERGARRSVYGTNCLRDNGIRIGR